MPASKVIPNLKYGGSGYSTLNASTGETRETQTSLDATFDIDWPLEERISVTADNHIVYRTLFYHFPKWDVRIGEAGIADYWRNTPPVSKEVYISDPHLKPLYYKDAWGQWWKQTVGCEFRQCGPNGEGGWCCEHTTRGWPLRKLGDSEATYATCSKLQPWNKECSLHNTSGGKPILCVMSPFPTDIYSFVKEGRCTVRWKAVDGPDV